QWTEAATESNRGNTTVGRKSSSITTTSTGGSQNTADGARGRGCLRCKEPGTRVARGKAHNRPGRLSCAQLRSTLLACPSALGRRNSNHGHWLPPHAEERSACP
ncbi:hypothetical protein GGH99_007686, partial [Coemansia sp. RSA 1285]